MSAAERRRDVRLKPIPELPARAAIEVDALMREALEVLDISAGGLGFSRAERPVEVGARIELRLSLADEPERRVAAIVRWCSPQTVGVQFTDVSDETMQALRRYVGELLERGLSV